MSDADRKIELAKIHIGKKLLKMDDDAYKAMLWTIANVHTSSDLDSWGRKKVIQHMKACGAVFKQKKRSTAANDKQGLIEKIKAMLADANRADAYADGMAKKMFHVDRYEWLQGDQLRRLVAALVYDAKRHGRRTK